MCAQHTAGETYGGCVLNGPPDADPPNK